MFTNVGEEDVACTADIPVNPRTTLFTSIGFSATNLLTTATVATGLSGKLLSAYRDMAIRAATALGQ